MGALARLRAVSGQFAVAVTGGPSVFPEQAVSNLIDLEATLAEGVAEGKIPHAVVFATSRDATFTYKHAVGKSHYPEDGAIKEDAVFLLASQTKLLTTIAALQVVERGLFGLDEDLSEQLPELGGQQIIQGFGEDDQPILVERKEPITLRSVTSVRRSPCGRRLC